MLERWIRDFNHAGRSLVRAPGFTLVVVATLALTIGANAAIFSVVNAVLREPLPYPHTDRLVHIGGTAPGTLIGIGVGLLAAVGLTTYIQTLLFDVGRLDVLAFAGMSAVMLAVALLASYIPSVRASRVDPVVALRAE